MAFELPILGALLSAADGTRPFKLTGNLFADTNDPPLLIDGCQSSNINRANNFTSAAANIPGADNIATPSFWPNAPLPAQIGPACGVGSRQQFAQPVAVRAAPTWPPTPALR